MFQTTKQLLFFFLKLFDHIWGEVISYLIAVDLHSDSISLDHYGLPPAELRFESMVCPNVNKRRVIALSRLHCCLGWLVNVGKFAPVAVGTLSFPQVQEKKMQGAWSTKG